MNYRHIYHAGNFADVFKHVILLALIQNLSQKDKPWCYLDTHAGKGIYDLNSKEAQKTGEYKSGIARIIEMEQASVFSLHPLLQEYINIVKLCGYPNHYPGSPFLVHACLRPKDRMILVEKHPEELTYLQQNFKNIQKNFNEQETNPKTLKSAVSIHHLDGYQALKAFLPPKERRGLILIDPPFEKTEEWLQIIKGLELGLARFQTGIFAVWYPIKEKKAVETFHKALQQLPCSEILTLELRIYPENLSLDSGALGLTGCGMVIINPPWKIETELNPLIQQLREILAEKIAGRE